MLRTLLIGALPLTVLAGCCHCPEPTVVNTPPNVVTTEPPTRVIQTPSTVVTPSPHSSVTVRQK